VSRDRSGAADAACPDCTVRIIWPVDAKGRHLPPVNWGPDPAGQMAIQHEVTGTWRGRFLGRGEDPIVPEKRFRLHKCERTS
jgi:hypothetical protein